MIAYALSSGIHWTSAVGGRVVVLTATNRRYILNHSASKIWMGLSSGQAIEAIEAAIAAEYDIPASQATTDVQSLLKHLRSIELISVSRDS
jgi:hypothetical protein